MRECGREGLNFAVQVDADRHHPIYDVDVSVEPGESQPPRAHCLWSAFVGAVCRITAAAPQQQLMAPRVVHFAEDEMAKFVLLSLHGVPPPPQKETHAGAVAP